MPDQTTTPLDEALAAAIEFAKAHGLETDPTPDDFGIQRSPEGVALATYVDGGRVVTATITRYGAAKFAIGEIDWIHDDADEARDLCDYCEVIGSEAFGLASEEAATNA